MEKIRLFLIDNGCGSKKNDSLEKYFMKSQERLEKELDLFNIVVAQRLLTMESNIIEVSSGEDQNNDLEDANMLTLDSNTMPKPGIHSINTIMVDTSEIKINNEDRQI